MGEETTRVKVRGGVGRRKRDEGEEISVQITHIHI